MERILFFRCHLECLMLKKRTLAVFTESAYEEVREGRGGPNIGGKGLVHSEHSPSPIKMNCYILSILNLT